jgi:RHS repeat-associated protein
MTAATSAKSGSNIAPFPANYTRDAANQLASDTSAASGTGSYKYTPLNQVCYAGSSSTTACSSPPTGSIPYTYDAADNLTKKGTVFQAFNNADELCWTASSSAACAAPPSGATNYVYDTRGNRVGVTPSVGQAQTLTYDQANRLSKFAAATTTSYGYNGDGLRMCKYSGSSTQPCQATGNTPYVWDAAGSLPLLLKDGTTAYVYGPSGLPLEQVNSSATFWFHHDQLGSTRLVTNSSGGTAATYTFDPYGGVASSTNPGGITNPLLFCGQYQDVESGFLYLRARYYDTQTAQFISADPIVGQTRAPFGYVKNNPLNADDASGLVQEPSGEGGNGGGLPLPPPGGWAIPGDGWCEASTNTWWFIVDMYYPDGTWAGMYTVDSGIPCFEWKYPLEPSRPIYPPRSTSPFPPLFPPLRPGTGPIIPTLPWPIRAVPLGCLL